MDAVILGLFAMLGAFALMAVASYYIDGQFPKLLDPFHAAMKENLRFIIIGLAIIIAVSIHACSTRYYSIGNRYILDRWTGQVQKPPGY